MPLVVEWNHSSIPSFLNIFIRHSQFALTWPRGPGFQCCNKIFIVDDEEDVRDVIEIALSDIGYEVHTAENGEEALRTFKTVWPPIVLTDIKIPGMNGTELLRKIKQENPDGYVHSALINILENAIDACLKDESKKSHKIGFSVKLKERVSVFLSPTRSLRNMAEKLF